MKDAEKKGIFIRSMAHRGYSGGVARALAGAVCVLDGLGQVAGAAMLIAGIAAPHKVLVRTDVGNVTILPKPMSFGKTGGGMGLAGTF